MNNVINSKTKLELYISLLAEIAKASNEIRCAESDLKKASGRISFSVAVLNQLIKREREGSKDETKPISGKTTTN